MPHAPTDRITSPLPRWPVLLGAAALLLAGCGLSDYEGQMASEAERLQRWDEETKVLGDPLRMPQLPKIDNKDQVWYVFLRPPHGVSKVPAPRDNSPLASLFGGLLAQYAGTGDNGIQGVYLGVGVDQKDYVGKVLDQFGGKSATDLQATIVRGPARNVAVKRKTFDYGDSTYSANFYEHKNAVVAVIYRMTKGNTQGNRAIEMSLTTLAEGDECGPLFQAYDKTHAKPKK